MIYIYIYIYIEGGRERGRRKRRGGEGYLNRFDLDDGRRLTLPLVAMTSQLIQLLIAPIATHMQTSSDIHHIEEVHDAFDATKTINH